MCNQSISSYWQHVVSLFYYLVTQAKPKTMAPLAQNNEIANKYNENCLILMFSNDINDNEIWAININGY